MANSGAMDKAGDAGRPWTAFWLALAALAVRLWQLGGKSLWGDELNMVAFARGTYDVAMSGGNAVGYFPVLRLADVLARHFAPSGEIGAADAWLRLPAALLGAATVPLLYCAGCRLAGRRVGLLAALLLIVSPMHVAHSQEVHSYAAFCLAALGLYELRSRAAAGEPSRRVAWVSGMAFAAVFAVGLYLHLFTLFLAAALLADVLLARLLARRPLLERHERWPVLGALVLAIVLSFPMWRDWIVPFGQQLVAKRLGAPAAPPPGGSGAAVEAAAEEGGNAGTAIFDMKPVFELKPATFLRASSQLVVWRGVFPGFSALAWLFFALGIVLLWRRSPLEARTFLVYFFLPLVPITIFSYLSRIDFGTRRLIFLLPHFWLAVAIALAAFGTSLAARLPERRAIRRPLGWLPALLFLFWLGVPMLGWYFSAYEKTDLRLAARLIARFSGPDDLILFYRPRNVLLHYPTGRTAVDPESLSPAKLGALRQGGRRVVYVRPATIDDWPTFVPVLEWLKGENRFDFRFGGSLRMAIASGESRVDSAVEAERWLRAAIAERPERFDLQAFLAQSLAIQGREEEARAIRSKAQSLRPERRFPTCLPWLCR